MGLKRLEKLLGCIARGISLGGLQNDFEAIWPRKRYLDIFPHRFGTLDSEALICQYSGLGFAAFVGKEVQISIMTY